MSPLKQCRACGNVTGAPICVDCRRQLPSDLRERLRYVNATDDPFEREAAILAALAELGA